MNTFLERLLEEKQQLDERTGKLGVFIGTENFFSIDPHQQSLLRCQFHAMKAYGSILGERIELLKPSTS